jgi:hypothetical protein
MRAQLCSEAPVPSQLSNVMTRVETVRGKAGDLTIWSKPSSQSFTPRLDTLRTSDSSCPSPYMRATLRLLAHPGLIVLLMIVRVLPALARCGSALVHRRC